MNGYWIAETVVGVLVLWVAIVVTPDLLRYIRIRRI